MLQMKHQLFSAILCFLPDTLLLLPLALNNMKCMYHYKGM